MARRQTAVTRRDLAGLIAAGAALSRPARAIEAFHTHDASRLAAPLVYRPPATLGAVRDLYSRMSVPVRINGQGPFPFVVDTGSNRTVISTELAGRLGLTAGEPASVNGVAGVRMAATAVARVDVGGHTTLEAPLLLLKEDDIGGPGLLGLDDLDGQAVTLDFRRETVRIESGRQLARDPQALTLKAVRRDGQLLLVNAGLDARRVIAFLDTGSDNTIGNLALRASAWNGDVNRPAMIAPIVSATGQTMDGQLVELRRLRLGSLTIASWPVTFANLHTFQMWDLVAEPAMLLGVDVLSRFDYVCLDFARDEVRFRAPGEG